MPDPDLPSCIDHTLLDLEAGPEDLARVCDEARRYGFKGVCVYPQHVLQTARLLTGSTVLTVSVTGFPSGLDSTSVKVDQTAWAVRDGAMEIDMVINRLWLESRDYRSVLQDIGAVVAQAFPCSVKVILETGALDRECTIVAAALAKAAGAAYVKTSTGSGPRGATPEDVALLRRVVGPDMGIKASGGIRTREQALALIRAGADRLGTSCSVDLVAGATD